MNKKIISLIAIYVTSWIILYSIPRGIYNVGGDQGISSWIIFIVIFIFLPYILFEIILELRWKENIRNLIVISSVFLVIPFTLLIGSEDEIELQKYQRLTKGKIVEVWISKNRRSLNINYVRAEYEVEGRIYQTSGKEDYDKKLHLNDQVTVIYSHLTPQNSEIISLLE